MKNFLLLILLIMGCDLPEPRKLETQRSEHKVKINRKVDLTTSSFDHVSHFRTLELESKSENKFYSCEVGGSITDDQWAELIEGNYYLITWEVTPEISKVRHLVKFEKIENE